MVSTAGCVLELQAAVEGQRSPPAGAVPLLVWPCGHESVSQRAYCAADAALLGGGGGDACRSQH